MGTAAGTGSGRGSRAAAGGGGASARPPPAAGLYTQPRSLQASATRATATR